MSLTVNTQPCRLLNKTSLLILSGVVALAAHPALAQTRSPDMELEDCVVSLHDQALIPAQQAGVLTALQVREGAMVTAGELLGQIDSSQQQLQHDLARIELQAAQQKAEEDIDIRFSQASAAVAETEYQQSLSANQRVQNTIPMPEVRRLKLAAHKTTLQIEKAESDQLAAQLALSARKAELKLAENELARCQITSPLHGQVVELMRRPGEWVNPGEAIARVIRLDVLRVEGFLNTEIHDPLLFENAAVTVSIKLANGRTAQFPGRIVFVSPLVQVGSQYRVWAEVQNKQIQGRWIIQPGMTASMKFTLP